MKLRIRRDPEPPPTLDLAGSRRARYTDPRDGLDSTPRPPAASPWQGIATLQSEREKDGCSPAS
eukprot:3919730-Pleurochrysis_carterae.AAC.2